ncbi:MAG: GNAT family N-acetyltransferase [Oscillospiraceae bacterium]|nr:GNAT family N-acetyltransferase [Oscillospiraceae bacterium]
MAELHCRPLDPADIPDMKEILLSDGGEYLPDRIAAFLNGTGNLAFGAFLDGRLIGLLYGYTLCRLDSRGPQFFVYSLDVLADFRNRGAGSALFQYAADHCRAAGYSEIFAATDKGNVPACRVYEKAGGRSHYADEIIYVAEW